MPRKSSLLALLLSAVILAAGPPAGAQQQRDRAALPGAPDQICPLPLGSPFPDLTLQTVAGKDFDLGSAIRAKPTILIYFRGGW